MADLSSKEIDRAIDLCQFMLKRAYCPYSNFPVACVLVSDKHEMITGCNVENASYGIGICAERTAAVKAVSDGIKKFKACFVLSNLNKTTAPCGACRQFLAEFNIDMTLYLVSKDRQYVKHQLKDLLPLAFLPSDLDVTV